MRSTAYTQPSGDAPNEDWFAITNDLVIVLDGATIRTDTGCIHGLPWYVRTLGAALITSASDHSRDLRSAIADSIRQVVAAHANTCDLEHPGTPSAAVGIVRHTEGRLDCAVLGDITVMLDSLDHEPRVLVDDRVSRVALDERAACNRHLIGTPEKMDAILAMKDLELAGRNRTGGYWIASVNPDAANHALADSIPLDLVPRFAVCSDGAMRALEMTSVTSYPGVLATLRHRGPDTLIDMVRAAEHRDPLGQRWPRNKATDDATAVFVETSTNDSYAPSPTEEERQAAIHTVTEMTSRNLMGEVIRH